MGKPSMISRGWLCLLPLVLGVGSCGTDLPSPGVLSPPTGSRPQAEGLGKDGELVVSMPATVVNRYAVLAADLKPGATQITLSSVAGQGVDALLPLAPDDLILIMQAQGAQIDTTNTGSYGSVIDLRSAGLYELVNVVAADPATNKLTIYGGCGGLKNSYQAAGHVQIIRVPQFTSLTVASAGSIVAPAWDGLRGGVVALQVRDTVTIDGKIDVAGRGFRGGQKASNSGLRSPGVGEYYRSMSPLDGGNRGEGIAGYRPEYLLHGAFGRGAAANGGGGGNRIAAGGGGGAGGGDISQWNGQGVMKISVLGGALAWPLDPGYNANQTGFSGGGRGGYTYSGVALDPTMIQPSVPMWGEDFRRERGGFGGLPMPNDPKVRLYFGGGGGGGDDYLNTSGAGGSGGGLVLIDAQRIAGSGQIIADGANGSPSLSAASGAGGGGGGGTIVVAATTTVTDISLSAVGGAGGNQGTAVTQAGGPGGGGGGGYLATASTVNITKNITGGSGGNTASTSMTGFPRNGASDGANGQLNNAAEGPYGGAPHCAVANLGIQISSTATQAMGIEPVPLTLNVTNQGPGTSTNLIVRLTLSDGAQVQSSDGQGWVCRSSGSQLTCTLTTLPVGMAPALSALVTPGLGAASMTATAVVSAASTDQDTTDNTALLTIDNPAPVIARPAGGGLGCMVTSAPAENRTHSAWLLGMLVSALSLLRRRSRVS